MRIGLTQMDILWEDKNYNKEQCLWFIKRAREQGVELLVFPEMTLTGFSMNASYISADEPESTRSFFAKASLEYDMAICYGYTQRVDGMYRNKCSLVSKGTLLSDYAKIHPFSYGEEGKYFTGGSSLTLAPMTASREHWNIGTAICYDLRFPELFQALSQDAELILVIANWPRERLMHWDTLLRARAIENQCYICGVNRVGEGNGLIYQHSSVLYDPLGNALTQDSPEELLTADIHPDMVRHTRESFALKKDRKPALYSSWYGNMARKANKKNT